MGCTPSTSADHRQRKTFRPIPDRFTSITQVQAAVREAGLESSNLILGVDFTKSNTWTGRETFGGRSLHEVRAGHKNPYQQVISVLGNTLEEFDDDRLIPAFGFGDTTTGDRACFPFHEGGKPSHGVAEVLERYEEIATTVNLAGPTSFAPVIREAIRIVQEERSYHILVIIADGQVTDASPCGETAQAIIEASNYPLSIVVVGVGDGPWGVMEEYDDELPERHFDNFQFVDYSAVVGSVVGAQIRSGTHISPTVSSQLEARFALAALMEIPDQYAFIKKSGLLSTPALDMPVRTAQLAASPRSQKQRRSPSPPPQQPPQQPPQHWWNSCPCPDTSSKAVGTAVPTAMVVAPPPAYAPPNYQASAWQSAQAAE